VETIFPLIEKACVLVTLAFVLTRTRLFAYLLRPRLPAREQATALLIFLLMGFTEVAVARQHSLMNARIIAVCAGGLLAGPWVGGLIGVAVTVIACVYQQYLPIPIGVSMLLAGLAGGLLHRWRPGLALLPVTGFVLGALTSLVRYGLLVLSHADARSLLPEGTAAVIQGLGVALILLVVAQVRAREAQARAAAMAEVRALQARMNPHFLFNALNTLSALSAIDPRAVPGAAARLSLFLRASLDQHERPFVRLREELEVVRAYLDVESLRMGERLTVEQEIAPRLLGASVPPFLLQPLVENAVRHGIQPRPEGGLVRLAAHREASWLLLTVSDTGVGIPPEERARLFRADDGHVHALTLLRRRLQGLYGSAFALTVESDRGAGASVSVRIPLCEEDWPGREDSAAPLGTARERQEADADDTVRRR
jgi:two-component system sensor histidine kinase LytS